jgi:hypothetical protein
VYGQLFEIDRKSARDFAADAQNVEDRRKPRRPPRERAGLARR